MSNVSTAEIMDRGINCLLEKLGSVETERFISVRIRERFDYTKWRRQYFDDVDAKNSTQPPWSMQRRIRSSPKRVSCPLLQTVVPKPDPEREMSA